MFTDYQPPCKEYGHEAVNHADMGSVQPFRVLDFSCKLEDCGCVAYEAVGA